MRPGTERLFQAVLALPEEERSELIEALLVSQDQPDELPFDQEWLAEIQSRSAEVDSGSVQLTPWSIVRERVRQRLETPWSG
jgi:putative addiction module component (TIGR02574 family)